MTYSTLATQADTPTAGPNAAYLQQVADNFAAIRQGIGGIVWRTTTQTISSSATIVPISFDTEVVDKGGCVDIGGQPTRITVPASMGGRWIVGGTLFFNDTVGGSGPGNTFAAVRLNNTTDLCETLIGVVGLGNGSIRCSMLDVIALAAGDYIQLTMWTNTNVGQAVAVAPCKPTMWAWRLSS